MQHKFNALFYELSRCFLPNEFLIKLYDINCFAQRKGKKMLHVVLVMTDFLYYYLQVLKVLKIL